MSSGVSALVRTRLTAPRAVLAALALVSAGLLAAAFYMQYVVGLPPCILCLYQRLPYLAVIALGGFGAVFAADPARARGFAAVCTACFTAGAGLALFHVGVEEGWWQGTSECVGGGLDAQTVEALRAAILAAPTARCDQVLWRFLGLSLAGWNLAASLSLTAATLAAVGHWRRRARR